MVCFVISKHNNKENQTLFFLAKGDKQKLEQKKSVEPFSILLETSILTY